MGHTFLSYSRQQYYFAESLALHLQERGLPVWFDVQQLEPGIQWAADIEAGLQTSTSLTLVASQDALASPYVEREWRHALDAGKPIVIALYERTRLPNDLRRRAVVVDFRGNFVSEIEALSHYLQNPHLPNQPARTYLRLPRLTAGVLRLALALLLDDLRLLLGFLAAFGVAAYLLADDSPIRLLLEKLAGLESAARFTSFVPLILAAFGGILAFGYLRQYRKHFKASFFLRHNFVYEVMVSQLGNTAGWGKIVQVWLSLFGLVYGATVVVNERLLPVTNMLQENNWLVTLLLLLLFRVALVYAVRFVAPSHPHPDVVRWARPGMVPQEWRIRVNGARPQPAPHEFAATEPIKLTPNFSSPTPARPLTYRVIYAPGDDRAAQQVSQALEQIGYRPAGDEPSGCTPLLLSYRTPLALVHDCMKTQQGMVGVLVTDVILPDNLPQLTSLQLVDYRNQQYGDLITAFNYLTHDDAVSRASFSLRLLPVNLARRVGNQALQSIANFLIILSFINWIYVAYFVGRLVLLSIPIVPIPAVFLPQAVGCAALLLISLVLLWFTLGVLRGQARFPVRLLLVVAAASLPLIALIELSAPLVAQVGPITLGNESGIVYLNQQPALMIALACLLVLIVVFRTLKEDNQLLVRTGTPRLAMRRIQPRWQQIFGILAGILVIMALSLIERG